MKKIIIIIAAIFISTSIFSQCYPDRHNTNWYDGWVSCESSQNPNPTRGNSHWVMYNFDTKYVLNNMHIWNTNDPNHLDWGMKNIYIDLSDDGETWTNFGTFILTQATGKSIYEGQDLVDFNGAKAKYLLITAVDNYGGTCYGLSEIKIEAHPSPVETEDISAISIPDGLTANISPNPFSDKTIVTIYSTASEDVNYTITDAMGKQLLSGKIDGSNVRSILDLNSTNFVPGAYFLVISQGNISKEFKMVVIK